MTGYRLTETAERDLDEILSFIAERDGVDRALRVHSSFARTFDSLATLPGSGRRREQLTPANVRWRPVLKFLVVYYATPRPIEVLRIIHGARDLPRLFGQDT